MAVSIGSTPPGNRSDDRFHATADGPRTDRERRAPATRPGPTPFAAAEIPINPHWRKRQAPNLRNVTAGAVNRLTGYAAPPEKETRSQTR